MTVYLTEKAAFRLRAFTRANDATSEKGVRFAAVNGGCSGFEYKLDIVEQPETNDLIYEQDKVKIYIDPDSNKVLDGVVIDFVESLTQAGFTFENPNASGGCGCGKSFSVEDCETQAVPCS